MTRQETDRNEHATPPIFVSHGSPMTALQPGAAGAFWRQLGTAIDQGFGRPSAIIAISAHSLGRQPALLAAARHHTVHDFSGFPQALYELRYDAPGAPELAPTVAKHLAAAGIDLQISPEGGLDHGIWTPLRFAWPDADVPVLPLVFPPDWSPQRLMALGRALAPLASKGVLVVGTGSITHNLQMVYSRGGLPPLDAPELAESASFRQWMRDRSAAGDWPALQQYRQLAPHAVLMHPTDEHLLPWFVAAGAGDPASPGLRLHSSLTYGCLGMDAYAFGPSAARLASVLAESAQSGLDAPA